MSPETPTGPGWGAGLLTRAGAGVLWASAHLSRVRFLHQEREVKALADYGAVIYALWHGRLWLLAGRLYRRHPGLLVSLSRDGEILAQVAAHLGYHPVRGSSSRGGAEGFRDLERCLAEGRSVALTPDGPRGPSRRAQAGAAALAARSGIPILPMGAGARKVWRMNSWDGFEIPWPGARAAIVFGEPLLVPSTGDLEPWRLRLEESLNTVVEEADREVQGHRREHERI